MTFDEWYATQKHQLSNEQVCRVIWDAATKAEREECVMVCEDAATAHRDGFGYYCAAMIRTSSKE